MHTKCGSSSYREDPTKRYRIDRRKLHLRIHRGQGPQRFRAHQDRLPEVYQCNHSRQPTLVHTWIYENRAPTLTRFSGSVFDHREICSPGGTVVVIHGDLDVGAIETWEGALDPESITILPNDVLVEG